MSDDQKRSTPHKGVRAAEPVRESADDEPPANVWGVSYAADDDRELTTEEIERALKKGEIGPRTLVWRPGMPTWRPLDRVKELSKLLPTEPKPKQRLSETSNDEKRTRAEPRQKQSVAKPAGSKASSRREHKSARPAPAEAAPQNEPPTVIWLPLIIGVGALFGFWFTRGEPSDAHHADTAPSGAATSQRALEPAPPETLATTAPLVEAAESSHAAEPARAAEAAHAAGAPPAIESAASAPAPPESARALEPTASAQPPEPAAPAAGAAGTAPFDKLTALRAFAKDPTKVARCRNRAEPEGTAHVTVTIDPSGRVTDARVLQAPYVGTLTAKCIISRIKGVTIPPFSGEAVTLRVPVELY